jgi:hypothetical protein
MLAYLFCVPALYEKAKANFLTLATRFYLVTLRLDQPESSSNGTRRRNFLGREVYSFTNHKRRTSHTSRHERQRHLKLLLPFLQQSPAAGSSPQTHATTRHFLCSGCTYNLRVEAWKQDERSLLFSLPEPLPLLGRKIM